MTPPTPFSPPPFLEIDGLTRRFGALTALDGVSLTVGQDELVVVLGPTGAGKTTLLRAIAGLEAPDGGDIRMAGASVLRQTPAERDVALVFQNFSLYPRWSVRKNLAFPLRAPGRRLPEAEIARRIDQVAAVLHIERLLDRPANRLSGGEMQRVAIGRAIVREPRLFLLDEPLTNLDAKLRESLRIELVELRRRLGTPMLFVTHDQAEALSMADRIVVLGAGKVLQTGTPEAVYQRPVSPLVARQLGQPAINLIPATARGGQWVADCDGSPAAGPTLCPCTAADGERRLLGIRPEAIAPSGGDGAAHLAVVEHMGPATIQVCDWGGLRLHLLVSRQPCQAGDTIYPKVDPKTVITWPLDAPGAE